MLIIYIIGLFFLIDFLKCHPSYCWPFCQITSNFKDPNDVATTASIQMPILMLDLPPIDFNSTNLQFPRCLNLKRTFINDAPLPPCLDDQGRPNYGVTAYLEEIYIYRLRQVTFAPNISETQQVTSAEQHFVTIPDDIYAKSDREKLVLHQARPLIAEIEAISLPGELQQIDGGENQKRGSATDGCFANESGKKCCNTDLENALNLAFDRWQAAGETAVGGSCKGNVAYFVQQELQNKFRMSFEIIVSSSNVGSLSSFNGNLTCAIQRGNNHLLAYATPNQYDISNFAFEDALRSADITNPATCDQLTMAEKQEFVDNLNNVLNDKSESASKNQGDGSGGADGDSCYINDSGHLCCNTELENTLNQAFDDWLQERNARPVGADCKGRLADFIQNAVQHRFNMSFEVFVSSSAVGRSTHETSLSCGLGRDGKNVFAYATPRQYEIKNLPIEDILVNIDVTNPATCEAPGGGCHINPGGYKCCNLELEDVMNRTFIEWRFYSVDCNIGMLANYIQLAAENRFQRSFETIVANTAIKTRPTYDSDLICGFIRGGKHVVVWSNPSLYNFDDVPVERGLNLIDLTHPFRGYGIESCLVPDEIYRAVIITEINDPAEIVFADSPQVLVANPEPPQLFFVNPDPPQVFAPFVPNPPPVFALTPAFQCFSGDTQVFLSNGKLKRLDELQVNEWIIGIKDDKLANVQIKSWIHRKTAKITEFLVLNLSNGKNLKLTKNHFIFKTSCANSRPNNFLQEIIPAKNLHNGDCLVTWNGIFDNSNFFVAQIIFINKTIEQGFYAPDTLSGNLFVNGILASCYSNVKSERIYWFFNYIKTFISESVFSRIFSEIQFFSDNNDVDLLPGVEIIVEIVNFVVKHF